MWCLWAWKPGGCWIIKKTLPNLYTLHIYILIFVATISKTLSIHQNILGSELLQNILIQRWATLWKALKIFTFLSNTSYRHKTLLFTSNRKKKKKNNNKNPQVDVLKRDRDIINQVLPKLEFNTEDQVFFFCVGWHSLEMILNMG